MNTPDFFLSWLEPDRMGVAHGRIDPFDPADLSKLKAEAVSALSIGRDVGLTLYSGRSARAIVHGARDEDRFVVIFIDSDERLRGQVENSFADAITRVREAVSRRIEHSVVMLRESFLMLNDWQTKNPRYIVGCNFAGISTDFEHIVQDRLGAQLLTKLVAFLCADYDLEWPPHHAGIGTLRTLPRVLRGFEKEAPVVSINIDLGDVATRNVAAAKDGTPREESNRLRVVAARESLLNSVPMYLSEELADLRSSTTKNASQLGQDLRQARKVFGVRHGRAWYYPRFQFDRQGVPHPEISLVLSALGNEAQGFDYLQWFLQQNAHLNGKTPLEIWDEDRTAVVKAAQEAHWLDRE